MIATAKHVADIATTWLFKHWKTGSSDAVREFCARRYQARAAIERAIAEAQSGDVVVIAGKGHEDYQIIGQEVLHFDDREVARETLRRLRAPA